jgi:hypothetical protein
MVAQDLMVESSGIPYLAKNERDMGHPGLVIVTEVSNGFTGVIPDLKPVQSKAIVGLRPSFSSHVRLGERGAPVRFPPVEKHFQERSTDNDTVARQAPWYPTSREKRARYGAPVLCCWYREEVT